MVDLNKLAQSLIDRDMAGAQGLTKAAIDARVPAGEILTKGIVKGMEVVGDQFGRGEIYLPEVLMSGEAARAAMKLLRPLLTAEARSGSAAGKIVMGTVQGDLHDIGKNLVIMMLEANGWEVTDLGIDVSPETFCSNVRDGSYQILGLSALLTSTMPNLGKTIEALKAAGLRSKIKIAVGGAPLNQKYADQIGADCYAADAADAVKKFKLLSVAAGRA